MKSTYRLGRREIRVAPKHNKTLHVAVRSSWDGCPYTIFMDVPCKGHPEAATVQYKPLGLPHYSSTTFESSTDPSQKLGKRKSLRLRPTEHDYALPSTPLSEAARQPDRPDIRPRASKMSLFSLFSKPKVEKLRGYAEQGLDASTLSHSRGSNVVDRPRKNHAERVRDADAQSIRSRPFSPKPSMRSRRPTATETASTNAQGSTVRPFDPPPLFQVWPQAIKYATLVVSNVAPENAHRTTRPQLSSAAFSASSAHIPTLSGPHSRASVDASRVVRSAMSYMASGGVVPGYSLSKKIIVLVTSGYVLQYAGEGPSDRLPERTVQLGKDSAAYASDLIPGKHHVLQISQTVEQPATEIPASNSFLSRIGLRNQKPRQVAPQFLLVMSGPEELNEWMTAVRQGIEGHGGKRARSDSSTSRPKTSQGAGVDLKRHPSQSHRYQVRRDPEKPCPIPVSIPNISPMFTSFNLPADEESASTQPSDLGDKTAVSDSKADERLVQHHASTTPATESDATTTRPASSRAPSFSSSTATSIEQQLDKLRDSAHLSHASTAATSLTAASRANSVASSPCEPHGDNGEPVAEPHFRSLASYNLAKRRSAIPLSLQDTGIPLSTASGQSPEKRLTMFTQAIDSPTMGSITSPTESSSPHKGRRLSAAKSAPDLKAKADRTSKHTPPIPLAPSDGTGERPESFLADLPDPTTWGKQASPSQRSSTVPFPALDVSAAQAQKKSSSPVKSSSPTSRPLRSGSNSFSRPLRPSNTEMPVADFSERPPAEGLNEKAMSSAPTILTSVAKGDSTSRASIDASTLQARQSSNIAPANTSAKRTSSSRLSLFPTSMAGPFDNSPISANPRDSHNPTTGLAVYVQATPNGARLARPASLQVRSSHAPFLASMRTCSAPNTAQVRTATTVPIRSLKPSRSVATMQRANTTKDVAAASPDMNAIAMPVDHLTPLPPRTSSSALHAFSASRGPRTRASLPQMDFGVSLVGLGPPAPPPSVPLPAIPSGSRPQSPEVLRRPKSVLHPRRPAGAAFGESFGRARSSTASGLGIQQAGESS